MTTESRTGLTAARRGLGPTGIQGATKSSGLTAGLLFAGFWWFLSNGSPESWLIGLPAVAAAVWAWLRLKPDSETRLSMGGLARFVPFFLWASLRGGVDVARRTLARPVRVNPGFIRYRTWLETSAARTSFASCLGLLPGTLAVDLKDDLLEIHTLDVGEDTGIELNRLEAAVARLVPKEAHDR